MKRELEESAKKVQHDNGERFVTSSHSIFSALPLHFKLSCRPQREEPS